MRGSRHWLRRAGLLAGAVFGTTLMVAVPVGAQEGEPPPAPPRPALEVADPELAQIARDILLLRIINQVGMTADQIAAVIPTLEGLLSEEQAMREDVKRVMLEQRRALLAGDVPEAQLQESHRKMRERTQAFREGVRKRLAELNGSLKDEQVKRLSGLVMMGPSVWRHGPSPRDRGESDNGPSARDRGQLEGGESGQPWRTRRTMALPPTGEEMGPSVRVLERVIVLLKEKLQVMRGAA